MQTKQAPPMTVLYYAADTTLNDLDQFWNVTAQGIYREVTQPGPWDNLPDAYNRLMPTVFQQGQ